MLDAPASNFETEIARLYWMDWPNGSLPQGIGVETDLRDAANRSVTLRSRGRWLAQLHTALPDLVTVIEDVFSHENRSLLRLHHHGTHSGSGFFGTATQRKVRFRSALYLEHSGHSIELVQDICDMAGALRGFGSRSSDWASRQPPLRGKPPEGPKTLGNGIWAETYAAILNQALSGDFQALHDACDPAIEVAAPISEGFGGPFLERFWLGLRGAVPEGDFHVEQRFCSEEPLSSPRAGIKWVLHGTHSGWGRYGAPTGAPLVITGCSFCEFGPAGIRRDWTIVDDAAVWRQVQGFTCSSSYPANA